jgi:hypothetical protein
LIGINLPLSRWLSWAASMAAAPGVGLGKFFATGLAADKLADGFSEKLSK